MAKLKENTMNHKWLECECNQPGCEVCNGGLMACDICGGAEGSLTTDCCGYAVHPSVLDAVYEGGLDFINGQWVVPAKEIVADRAALRNWRREIKKLGSEKPLKKSRQNKAGQVGQVGQVQLRSERSAPHSMMTVISTTGSVHSFPGTRFEILDTKNWMYFITFNDRVRHFRKAHVAAVVEWDARKCLKPIEEAKKYIEYAVETTALTINFHGKFRRDLELEDWHRYETCYGSMISFKKCSLVSVYGDTVSDVLASRATA